MSSLFDRLAQRTTSGGLYCQRQAPGQKFEVIRSHLEALLNTRRGCSQSSPDLGLRDFNGHDLSRGDLLEQVSSDIRRTIQRYEPRIEVIALHGMPDAHNPLELHFRLDCQVLLDNRAKTLQIELVIDGHNRYIRVR